MLFLVASLGGLLFIAWHIVAETAVDNDAADKTDVNLAAVSSAAAILDQTALDQVKRIDDPSADLDEARRAAQQALRLDPLDARALALLALIAERRGNHGQADTLMQLAAERTWHDPIVQTWMIVRDTQRQDFGGAVNRAAALFKTNPELEPGMLRALIALTTEPAALHHLISAMLATDPPWRAALLAQLCDQIKEPLGLVELYRVMEQSRHPPTADELRPYLNRLIASGHYRDAYHDWLVMTQSWGAGNLKSEPYDGDFSTEPRNLAFDWFLPSFAGARAAIVPISTDSHALYVEFSGAHVSFTDLSQLLLLAPGAYQLSGLVRAQDLRTTRGLWWQIECLGPSPVMLAHTGLVRGTVPWTKFSVDFQVPDKGCGAQRLALQLPARTFTEKQIAGEAWYRDLRISTSADAAAQPQ